MGGLDQPMRQLTLMRQSECTESKPEHAVPQVRRALIDDEGMYRQIQREPDAHYFQHRRHAHQTIGQGCEFREAGLRFGQVLREVRCTTSNCPNRRRNCSSGL